MERKCLKCGHLNASAQGGHLEACPACGAIYSKVERAVAQALEMTDAPNRGEQMAPGAERPPGDGFSQRQMVAIAGAMVLAVGVFMPLISGPMGMSVNYFSNGNGNGVFILGMAACTVALAVARRYALLWATGGLAAAVTAYSFWRIRSGITAAKEAITNGLEGNPFRGLADMAADSIQMQWGWAVLGIGALLVLVSAGMEKG